ILKSFGPDLVGWFDIDSIPLMQQARRNRVDTGVKLFSLGYPANAINKSLDLGLPHLPWGDRGYLPARLQEVTQAQSSATASPAQALRTSIQKSENHNS